LGIAECGTRNAEQTAKEKEPGRGSKSGAAKEDGRWRKLR